jgi:anti-sigma factor RsiW
MTEHRLPCEHVLHAYVDGELDPLAARRVQRAIKTSMELRRRVHELQRVKQWVRRAYEIPGSCDRPSTA